VDTDTIIIATSSVASIALFMFAGRMLDKEENSESEVVVDTTDGQRICYVKSSPLANEWPAGDPVPADKEMLGYVRRDNE